MGIRFVEKNRGEGIQTAGNTVVAGGDSVIR